MAHRGEKCLPSAKQRDANVSYRTTVSTANVSDQWFNRRTIVTSGQTGLHSITPGLSLSERLSQCSVSGKMGLL